ncbi:MAG: fluoride efflux transporter CrcB [Symploca sp. SIO1B1]|nr:fluoride efflux transporter CrcB [Symploca sp. SIO2D2]NER23490.1 fluoride efflux transporter CrcB [Symploca sp. SIO1C2]NER98947.1 fluoride efflux transporter CrcB [Symploca sp. SIO1B1]
MRFDWRNLVQLLAIASDFMPEVLQQPAVRNPLAVSLGAIGGALSRYYLSLWFTQQFGSNFPYATLFVNLTGSFIMGFFVTLILERGVTVSPELRLLIAVGFLGSYTTFSSYKLDTFNLLKGDQWYLALTYWAGSAILGIFSLYLGIVVARFLR